MKSSWLCLSKSTLESEQVFSLSSSLLKAFSQTLLSALVSASFFSNSFSVMVVILMILISF